MRKCQTLYLSRANCFGRTKAGGPADGAAQQAPPGAPLCHHADHHQAEGGRTPAVQDLHIGELALYISSQLNTNPKIFSKTT